MRVISTQEIKKLFIAAIQAGRISSRTEFKKEHGALRKYIKELEKDIKSEA